ncbi:MAG: InlB B-repeat-containing protein, partial [Betaproteobacteria bacterium]
DSGYKFDYWTIDGTTSTANRLSISMTSDHTVFAHFSVAQSPSQLHRHNPSSDDHDDHEEHGHFRVEIQRDLIQYYREYDYEHDYERDD